MPVGLAEYLSLRDSIRNLNGDLLRPVNTFSSRGRSACARRRRGVLHLAASSRMQRRGTQSGCRSEKGSAATLTRLAGAKLAHVARELAPQSDRLASFIEEQLHRRPDLADAFLGALQRVLKNGSRKASAEWPKTAVIQRLGNDVINRGCADQPKRVVRGLSWTVPRPPVVEPTNPDFDPRRLYGLIKPLVDAGMGFGAIANELNDLGHRNKRNESFDAYYAKVDLSTIS